MGGPKMAARRAPTPSPTGAMETFPVFVRTLEGTVSLEVSACDTVATLKRMIQNTEGIPAEEQRLVYGGRQLHDDNSLSEQHISKDSTLHLVLRLRGGAPKKKKKTMRGSSPRMSKKKSSK